MNPSAGEKSLRGTAIMGCAVSSAATGAPTGGDLSICLSVVPQFSKCFSRKDSVGIVTLCILGWPCFMIHYSNTRPGSRPENVGECLPCG